MLEIERRVKTSVAVNDLISLLEMEVVGYDVGGTPCWATLACLKEAGYNPPDPKKVMR